MNQYNIFISFVNTSILWLNTAHFTQAIFSKMAGAERQERKIRRG
jgi:hypothetical protein